MKHNLKITFILIIVFLVTQLFGLATINKNIVVTTDEQGEIQIEHQDTIVGEAPKTNSGTEAVLILSFAIIIGTLLILLFIKLKVKKLFKYWYLLAVFTTMAVTLSVHFIWFNENINAAIVLLLAATLAWFKVFRSNVFVHNITEIFVYSGISVLFVSLFDGWLWAAFTLLIIISLYDMFAVWQSKHMIKLAQYQTESKVFAGLSIPYELPKKIKKPKKNQKMVQKKIKTAILGGGDLAFPLLFSGAVMSHLITEVGIEKTTALLHTSIISVTTTIALFLLLSYGKKDTFYPAMPFLSAGCFVGYFIITLII